LAKFKGAILTLIYITKLNLCQAGQKKFGQKNYGLQTRSL